MGLLQSYSSILIRRPATVLLTCSAFVLFLFMITLSLRPLHSFNDPLIGFEARGSQISTRINTWNLLNDESSASANNISLTPNSHIYNPDYHFLGTNRQYDESNNVENTTDSEPELPIVEMSTQQVGNNRSMLNHHDAENLDEFEDEYYELVKSSTNSPTSLIHYSLDSSRAFCGKLYEGYSQVVVSPSPAYSRMGLFNLNSLLAICQLDQRLRLEKSSDDHAIFHKDCDKYIDNESTPESNQISTACCNTWSLPNNIACLANKTNCMLIDAKDMKLFEQMVKVCAPYYYKSPHEECFAGDSQINHQVSTGSINRTQFLNISLNQIDESYIGDPLCGKIPKECLKCGGWIYNVLHFLTNDNFIANKSSSNQTGKNMKSRVSKSTKKQVPNAHTKEIIINKLTYTNLFLPLAKSSSLMKYYHTLSRYNLKTPYAQIKVLNLGLKNSLFEHLVSNDMKLFFIALVSILLVISLYTWSLFLSLIILLIICLSLCLSYTIYDLILNIPIFPFMNLLAVVISFGICSDNAMLFCKQWSIIDDNLDLNCQQNDTVDSEAQDHQQQAQQKEPTIKGLKIPSSTRVVESNLDEEYERLDRMLKRAFMSTSAATLATACSFIISAISQVTAVKCFCIFATLSVMTNYLLIILLLPPALILDNRLKKFIRCKLKEINKPSLKLIDNYAKYYRAKFLQSGELFHQQWILNIVVQLKFYLIITFVTFVICASILVLRVGLQPSNDDDIQLLSKKHEFEQYDNHLRKHFAFEKVKQMHQLSDRSDLRMYQEMPATLPVRVVFGVLPVDNGNHYDPQDRGHLVFDPKFNLADENTQIWLLEFCHRLRKQRFIHPSPMIELSSCFIDTFKSWMEARTCHDPVHYGYDRSPCCQSFEFPFSQNVLDRCIKEAISIMQKTPHLYPNVNAGVRFLKNSTRVAALIVEFSSNRIYTDSFLKMEKFYNHVNEWVSWQINNTAPPGLRSGWFISSDMDLLALQSELEASTNVSILLEILFAMLALALSTKDLILTVAGTFTIGAIIVIVLAVLILLGWTLGVAESILISLTIGLSIDFALHYTVAYSGGLRTRASHGVLQRILSEVGSPIALATVTTSLAGFVIVWSDILAYQELGVFLMLIALTSWLVSTFFLLPMLATIDAIRDYCERYFRWLIQRALKMLLDRT